MAKISLCVLFGGVSSEHEVSRRSAASVLRNMDSEKYEVLPVGITREGRWLYYTGKDYAVIGGDGWENDPANLPAFISPDRGHGLLIQTPAGLQGRKIDCVFPVLHGENGEDGAVQGLLRLAGIPFVGSGIAASAVCMDKVITRMLADRYMIRQACWEPVNMRDFLRSPEKTAGLIEKKFTYPVFVKPAGTGSSVGVSKAKDRAALLEAIHNAGRFDRKVLVEEFIDGREIEVAVLGNSEPVASGCGEIIPGDEFYSYEAKYHSSDSQTVVSADLDGPTAEQIRTTAVKLYKLMGCRGLARVDFFVHRKTGAVIFNEINTLPGFTDISMYPKLMMESGIPFRALIDRLVKLAMED